MSNFLSHRPLFVSIIHETNKPIVTDKDKRQERPSTTVASTWERGAVHYLVPQLRGYSPSLDPGLVFLSPYNFLRQLIVLDRTYLKDSGYRYSETPQTYLPTNSKIVHTTVNWIICINWLPVSIICYQLFGSPHALAAPSYVSGCLGSVDPFPPYSFRLPSCLISIHILQIIPPSHSASSSYCTLYLCTFAYSALFILR